MPLGYNTAPPTPLTKNTINSVTLGSFTGYNIRDYLLNKNLKPTYPFLSTSVNGAPRIGEPILDTGINGNSNVIPFGLPLEVEGLTRYNNAISSNQFKNDDGISPVLLDINDITKIQGVFGNVEFPQGTQSYPTSANQDISTYGLLAKSNHAGFLKSSTIYNLYLDTDKQVDVSDWISLQPLGVNQQVKGYLDTYGSLNLGGSGAVQAANIIGSVLNGQGLGLAKGGVVTNYYVRASLAGRVLGATGLLNDTKLGMIGGQQLALALANNAAFNVEQSLLGSLNIDDNILSLVKNGTLAGFRPNYQITVASTGLGKAADYTARILGFTLPKSYLQDAGSIFSSENESGNIQRANSMIVNTGKGQVNALRTNVNANIMGSGHFDNPDFTDFRSGYVPGYLDNSGNKLVNPSLYAFYDDATLGTILNFNVKSSNLIPEISYNRSAMITAYGFKTPEDTFSGPEGNSGYDNRRISDVGFTWVGGGGTVNANASPSAQLPLTDKKSLLTKTQKLFNSNGMLNIISNKGDMGKSSSQIETANGGGFSKGSGVLSAGVYGNGISVSQTFDNAENTYCRSWTTLERYSNRMNLIRHSGLKSFSDKSQLAFRFNTENTTLDEFGNPKIAPYITDNFTDPKNYMFSIENLAWADNSADLPPVELGTGDLLTGKKGRIMWFPPYNIQFNETSNVDWETTKFIGRGEPIYTYNNTERTGNISFSIVVDHSSYMNTFRGSNGPDDNYVASFIAGCVDPTSVLSDRLSVATKSAVAQTVNNAIQQACIDTGEVAPKTLTIYFPNDIATIEDDVIGLGYENGMENNVDPSIKIDYSANHTGVGYGIIDLEGQYTPQMDSNGQPIQPERFTTYIDNFNYGLNNGVNHSHDAPENLVLDGVPYSNLTDYMSALAIYMNNKCKSCIASVYATASVQGVNSSNQSLSEARLDNTIAFLKKYMPTLDPSRIIKESQPLPASTGCVVDGPPDQFQCKLDRRAEVQFIINPNIAANNTVVPNQTVNNSNQQINPRIIEKMYNEGVYFEQLTDLDPFVFDSFRQKIRYFHPAFHSTTPEGLNSRLTFLQQCTRQGPTNGGSSANNLAFGRAPVCILRVGDFYNTKIIIDNVSIEYEPLVWDLNPEGVGVQPMIANVNLSFKFVGGSSLMGPIDKLQNALSFNYYANSQVYDPRADYIAKSNDITKPYNIVKGATSLTAYTTNNTTQAITTLAPPAINQPATANLANTTAPISPPPSGTTASGATGATPTITGFKSVEIIRIESDFNFYTVHISLAQIGVYDDSGSQIITNDVLKTFMSQNVKITLDFSPDPSGGNHVEEIINSTNVDSGVDGKQVFNLFSSGQPYFIGDITVQGHVATTLKAGNYTLKLFYNGQLIAPLAVSVGDSEFKI